jgi:hypothetical protein
MGMKYPVFDPTIWTFFVVVKNIYWYTYFFFIFPPGYIRNEINTISHYPPQIPTGIVLCVNNDYTFIFFGKVYVWYRYMSVIYITFIYTYLCIYYYNNYTLCVGPLLWGTNMWGPFMVTDIIWSPINCTI